MKKENIKMTRLSKTQLQQKIDYIDFYSKNKSNASSSSIFDANANVAQKNIATLSAEIHKDINIQINRELMHRKLNNLYGVEIADKYLNQLDNHEIYSHDESAINTPYCSSVSMYPFLLTGTESLGGDSKAPKHLETFCGGFINLVFLIASQFAGAVATTEFLMYFDHFARKDFGDNYLEIKGTYIREKFAQVVYTLNQPASARNFQSVFWNISIFDKYYFESMFGDFVFPDDDKPKWETVKKLQEIFMIWFNKERQKKVLTFPVITATLLCNETEPKDADFTETVSKELSEGNSFFVYMSDKISSLASCCRLLNELQENTFSYTLGAGGVMTGSVKVITLNLNRFIQNISKKYDDVLTNIRQELNEQIDLIHKYHFAYRSMLTEMFENGMLPIYSAGYIILDKQYSTIGINGLVESAEFMGLEISYNDKYKNYVDLILSTIKNSNTQAHKEYGFRFNTEFVPAENLGVKNAQWDKKDGYIVSRECYNSYFYIVEDETINPIEKFFLHGQEFTKNLDGGSALHLNLAEHLTQENYKNILGIMAKTGCPYLGINVKNTKCLKCGFIDKRTLKSCSECGSRDISYITRVIGFIKEIPAFSDARQIEEGQRVYHETRAF